MTPEIMWQDFLASRPEIRQEMDAWAFGGLPDQLAVLVLTGVKTATSSAYDLYALENEPLPQVGTYDVILDSQGQAVCVIRLTQVTVLPFREVTADHAYQEGEGDRSLDYWRQVHRDFFIQELVEAGLTFSEDSLVVCESFEKVYPGH